MSDSKLVIVMNDDYREPLVHLSDLLSLPIVEQDDLSSLTLPYVLQMQQGALCLQELGVTSGPVFVDFMGGAATHRRIKGGGELIVKAMGGAKQQRPSVLDVTAGLGRDSFVLASWGFSVKMVERCSVVAALLQDGIDRSQALGDLELKEAISRMQLYRGEARDYLLRLDEADSPDIIYIDPMFPPTKKSALVKKEMRAFHYLVGGDENDDGLLSLAKQKARHRVVVKRPKKAEYLSGQKPSFSLEGKAIRFDIYSLRAFSK